LLTLAASFFKVLPLPQKFNRFRIPNLQNFDKVQNFLIDIEFGFNNGFAAF